MYIVMLEWYDDNLDIESRGPAYFYFNTADDALFFAVEINRELGSWKNFGCPNNMYLYHVVGPCKTYSSLNQAFSEDQQYIAAWYDCGKHMALQR